MENQHPSTYSISTINYPKQSTVSLAEHFPNISVINKQPNYYQQRETINNSNSQLHQQNQNIRISENQYAQNNSRIQNQSQIQHQNQDIVNKYNDDDYIPLPKNFQKINNQNYINNNNVNVNSFLNDQSQSQKNLKENSYVSRQNYINNNSYHNNNSQSVISNYNNNQSYQGVQNNYLNNQSHLLQKQLGKANNMLEDLSEVSHQDESSRISQQNFQKFNNPLRAQQENHEGIKFQIKQNSYNNNNNIKQNLNEYYVNSNYNNYYKSDVRGSDQQQISSGQNSNKNNNQLQQNKLIQEKVQTSDFDINDSGINDIVQKYSHQLNLKVKNSDDFGKNNQNQFNDADQYQNKNNKQEDKQWDRGATFGVQMDQNYDGNLLEILKQQENQNKQILNDNQIAYYKNGQQNYNKNNDESSQVYQKQETDNSSIHEESQRNSRQFQSGRSSIQKQGQDKDIQELQQQSFPKISDKIDLQNNVNSTKYNDRENEENEDDDELYKEFYHLKDQVLNLLSTYQEKLGSLKGKQLSKEQRKKVKKSIQTQADEIHDKFNNLNRKYSQELQDIQQRSIMQSQNNTILLKDSKNLNSKSQIQNGAVSSKDQDVTFINGLVEEFLQKFKQFQTKKQNGESQKNLNQNQAKQFLKDFKIEEDLEDSRSMKQSDGHQINQKIRQQRQQNNNNMNQDDIFESEFEMTEKQKQNLKNQYELNRLQNKKNNYDIQGYQNNRSQILNSQDQTQFLQEEQEQINNEYQQLQQKIKKLQQKQIQIPNQIERQSVAEQQQMYLEQQIQHLMKNQEELKGKYIDNQQKLLQMQQRQTELLLKQQDQIEQLRKDLDRPSQLQQQQLQQIQQQIQQQQFQNGINNQNNNNIYGPIQNLQHQQEQLKMQFQQQPLQVNNLLWQNQNQPENFLKKKQNQLEDFMCPLCEKYFNEVIFDRHLVECDALLEDDLSYIGQAKNIRKQSNIKNDQIQRQNYKDLNNNNKNKLKQDFNISYEDYEEINYKNNDSQNQQIQQVKTMSMPQRQQSSLNIEEVKSNNINNISSINNFNNKKSVQQLNSSNQNIKQLQQQKESKQSQQTIDLGDEFNNQVKDNKQNQQSPLKVSKQLSTEFRKYNQQVYDDFVMKEQKSNQHILFESQQNANLNQKNNFQEDSFYQQIGQNQNQNSQILTSLDRKIKKIIDQIENTILKKQGNYKKTQVILNDTIQYLKQLIQNKDPHLIKKIIYQIENQVNSVENQVKLVPGEYGIQEGSFNLYQYLQKVLKVLNNRNDQSILQEDISMMQVSSNSQQQHMLSDFITRSNNRQSEQRNSDQNKQKKQPIFSNSNNNYNKKSLNASSNSQFNNVKQEKSRIVFPTVNPNNSNSQNLGKNQDNFEEEQRQYYQQQKQKQEQINKTDQQFNLESSKNINDQNERQEKIEFYDIAKQIRNDLPKEHKGQSLSISDLYNEAKNKKISREKWRDFLEDKLFLA